MSPGAVLLLHYRVVLLYAFGKNNLCLVFKNHSIVIKTQASTPPPHSPPFFSLNSDELVWCQNRMKGVVNIVLILGKVVNSITRLFPLFPAFFVLLYFNYTLLSPETKL